MSKNQVLRIIDPSEATGNVELLRDNYALLVSGNIGKYIHISIWAGEIEFRVYFARRVNGYAQFSEYIGELYNKDSINNFLQQTKLNSELRQSRGIYRVKALEVVRAIKLLNYPKT